jgi:hypothetical protein
MALKPPVEVPQGAIRLNTDSQKLEFYAQDQWWQMATDVPTLDGGGRGLFGGGYTPTAVNTIDYITIESAGNAIDFGDLNYTDNNVCSSTASRTRGMWFGGGTEPDAENDNISYLTIASTGNAADFGNLTQARRGSAAVASATRAVICGGRTPTVQNIMDYVTIASTGNAVDFGDIDGKDGECSSMSPAASPTRGVLAGGTGPTNQSDISYITIATLGNDQHFGDLSSASNGTGGCSNSTRAIFRIRESTTIDTIQIATRGNGTSFGSGPSSIHGSWANSPTRGVFGTYINAPSPTALSNINYISLQTGGDSIDFGDLSQTRKQRNGGCSNAHGGL